MCRLSCTATLILSINNNPPHCRPGPHLLITICHLSDAPHPPPPPSPAPDPPPPPSLPPHHPKLCSPPLHPSQQGQLSSVPPSPTPSPHRLTPSPLAFSRETWSSIQRAALSLSPCLALTYFNCTGEGVEFIKRKGGVGDGGEALEILIGGEEKRKQNTLRFNLFGKHQK